MIFLWALLYVKCPRSLVLVLMEVPSDYNVQMKMTKYVELQIECQRMWKKKVEVVPIIRGATGIVEKNMKKYQANIISTIFRDQQF